MAVAVAGGYSFDWTPSRGPPDATGVALKKKEKRGKKKFLPTLPGWKTLEGFYGIEQICPPLPVPVSEGPQLYLHPHTPSPSTVSPEVHPKGCLVGAPCLYPKSCLLG